MPAVEALRGSDETPEQGDGQPGTCTLNLLTVALDAERPPD